MPLTQSSFFSSRRRHTRYWRDWSSDVCSSDLVVERELLRVVDLVSERDLVRGLAVDPAELTGREVVVHDAVRSEERRVGKECRSRRSPYHYKKREDTTQI